LQVAVAIVTATRVLLSALVAHEAEFENAAWRHHHVVTGKLAVVVQFLSESEILVVTAC